MGQYAWTVLLKSNISFFYRKLFRIARANHRVEVSENICLRVVPRVVKP